MDLNECLVITLVLASLEVARASASLFFTFVLVFFVNDSSDDLLRVGVAETWIVIEDAVRADCGPGPLSCWAKSDDNTREEEVVDEREEEELRVVSNWGILIEEILTLRVGEYELDYPIFNLI